MVLLDTNVVSELMLDFPNPAILAWMDDQASRELFVTAVTEAEIRTGVAFLPEGVRRWGLLDAVERILGGLFADRVLPFDSAAARAYADIAAARRAAGRPMSQPDCQIAAIALSCGMAVATRNVRDFSETGVDVIDPWAGE
ncbi:MAG: type II toxin-antitoxin system VapC family toxin [Nitrospinae bacterium]|nr:type II toxin-antitoxin system VapC family toxin [Nitrospinota bacterium]